MTTTVQWWCSARGAEWDWRWQAYPGIWIAVGGVAWWMRRVQKRGSVSRPERFSGVAGVVLLWVTLDWPVGPIGTGYLASVHALQFVSLALLVPPLVLFAVRHGLRRASIRDQPSRWEWLITNPVVAGVVFSVVLFVTHAPGVVDTLMRRQAGAFALDAAWLFAGGLFWWPVIVRRPEREWFNPLLAMLYVFFGTQAHLGIAMWLLMAQFPVYGTYELTPRIIGVSALEDQQLAGGIMIAAVEPIVFGVITLVFFRWFRDEPDRVPDATVNSRHERIQ